MLYAYEPLAPPMDDVVDGRAHRETWDDMLYGATTRGNLSRCITASIKELPPVLMGQWDER